jgi:uncharacterized protein DUF5989
MRHDTEAKGNSFEAEARKRRPSFLGEFWGFLKHNKKWWLLPMLAVMLALGVLVLLGGSPFAPFIYTLF